MGSGWRIVPARHAQAAFTGEGPWRYGGRWNSPGVRVVYVSQHQSTAAFEVFANRMPFILERKYKAFYAEWPDSLTERFPPEKLPASWRIHPPPIQTREIGDAWIKERRSAVLALPSVVAQPAAFGFQTHPRGAAHRFRVRFAPVKSLITCSRGR
jgi:RES domain-containing protein